MHTSQSRSQDMAGRSRSIGDGKFSRTLAQVPCNERRKEARTRMQKAKFWGRKSWSLFERGFVLSMLALGVAKATGLL